MAATPVLNAPGLASSSFSFAVMVVKTRAAVAESSGVTAPYAGPVNSVTLLRKVVRSARPSAVTATWSPEPGTSCSSDALISAAVAACTAAWS